MPASTAANEKIFTKEKVYDQGTDAEERTTNLVLFRSDGKPEPE